MLPSVDPVTASVRFAASLISRSAVVGVGSPNDQYPFSVMISPLAVSVHANVALSASTTPSESSSLALPTRLVHELEPWKRGVVLLPAMRRPPVKRFVATLLNRNRAVGSVSVNERTDASTSWTAEVSNACCSPAGRHLKLVCLGDVLLLPPQAASVRTAAVPSTANAANGRDIRTISGVWMMFIIGV